jgi:hypothetical protein
MIGLSRASACLTHPFGSKSSEGLQARACSWATALISARSSVSQVPTPPTPTMTPISAESTSFIPLSSQAIRAAPMPYCIGRLIVLTSLGCGT